MEEGTLAAWLVQDRSQIEKGQEIAEIETTKIANVFESPVSGSFDQIFNPRDRMPQPCRRWGSRALPVDCSCRLHVRHVSDVLDADDLDGRREPLRCRRIENRIAIPPDDQRRNSLLADEVAKIRGLPA